VESITSGVAFLAAGFIILRHGEIRGITTGAGMWLAAAIGLASGLGMFAIACAASAIGLVTLAVLRRMEKRFELREERDSRKEVDD
jgi:putative Mg2+ transporter-C (MgtC) family protein